MFFFFDQRTIYQESIPNRTHLKQQQQSVVIDSHLQQQQPGTSGGGSGAETPLLVNLLK